MLCLPRRRDAQIEGGALRHGHAGNLLTSSRRPEKFVEKVAEPGFEHRHLGLCDGNARRPVISNGPGRRVDLERAADMATGRASVVVEVVGKIQESNGRVMGMRHAGSVMPESSALNSPIARFSRPRASGGKDRRSALVGGRIATPPPWSRKERSRSLSAMAASQQKGRAGSRRSRPQPRSGGASRQPCPPAPGPAGLREALMAQTASRSRVAMPFSTSGRSSAIRSCVSVGVMRPRSPRSSRTSP